MHIHPFCGSIEDHEEKDTDKSIIWAKWVYIMVEKGMLLWKRIPKWPVCLKILHFGHPHNGISAQSNCPRAISYSRRQLMEYSPIPTWDMLKSDSI
jgi:hypothetical protein